MKLLAVDDEEVNLLVLNDALTDEGFDVIVSKHGKDALSKLSSNPDVGVILLDRMMPEMDGMTLFNAIRSDERYANVPVIMQTAMADKESVLEGVQAGVYHYLTKPYKREMLLAVVNAAVRDVRRNSHYVTELRALKDTLHSIHTLNLTCQTVEEAQRVAHLVAYCFPEPERVVVGLVELITNGIEHGNLNIGGDKKMECLRAGNLHQERERLFSLPQNRNKKVHVDFEKESDGYVVKIRDEGPGFNWQAFLLNPNYGKDVPLGRGISIAQAISFDEISYNAVGNEVVCRVRA